MRLSLGQILSLVTISVLPATAQTTLNLSQDLVRFGISSSNLAPDRPDLDAGPLMFMALEYAKANRVGRVIVDKGAYYFTSLQNGIPFHMAQDGLQDMTIDLQGSDLYFRNPLMNGIQLSNARNLVLQNFTLDYDPLPFTQVRVVSVDAARRQVQFSALSGWQNPTVLNAVNHNQANPGSVGLLQVHVFRNGRQAPGLSRMTAALPVAADRFTIGPATTGYTTNEVVAQIRPGDIAVLAMNGTSRPLSMAFCTNTTLRNITAYSSLGDGVEAGYSDSVLFERVHTIPRPGTDRLVSTFGNGLTPMGANNTIRLSRHIRTMDDGFSLFLWITGFVESKPTARTLVVAPGVGATGLLQFITIPNGLPVAFENPADGSIVGSAVIVSQDNPPRTQPYRVTYTFDRDLPANLVGAAMYTTDASRRGAGTVIERSAVMEQTFGTGISIWGVSGATLRGNYIFRSAMTGFLITHQLGNAGWAPPPTVNLTLNRNILDATNSVLGEHPILQLAGIESIARGPNFTDHTAPSHQGIAVTNNFIANPSRSAIWFGNVNGGSATGNYFLNPNNNPSPQIAYPLALAHLTDPIALNASLGVATSGNTIETASRLFVTDLKSTELAAYAPGAVMRLNAFNVGKLDSPTVNLTDADGVTLPVAIQATATHALDVRLPAATALGGAYITLTSGGAKYFGTLFVDSQDNIPMLNGCTYWLSPSAGTIGAAGGVASVLVVTEAGCAWSAVTTSSFVTPGAASSGTGVLGLNFAANTGAEQSAAVEIAGQTLTFTQAAAPVGPVITGVVNGASFLPQIASSAWITIQGSRLSTTSRSWSGSDFLGANLPVRLDGISVDVNGLPAYVYYISPNQLNVLAPDDSAVGTVEVRVTTAAGTSNTFSVRKANFAPAFFPVASKYAAAVHTNGALVGPAGLIPGANVSPAKTGEAIALYGTGFGATTPASPAGQILGAAAALANQVSVSIGGVAAVVTFAGRVSSGLEQINVIVPSGLSAGDLPIVATVNGVSTPANQFLTIAP